MGKIVNQDLPADPPAPSAGSHVIYSKAGGVFVRSPSGVVGPLSAGGTVNNLQDAYDGGPNADITTTIGRPVQVIGAATGDALRSTTSGTGSAVYAETTGVGNGVTIYASPAATGNALSSLANGTGSAVYAEANGAGNGVTAYAAPTATGNAISSFGSGTGSAVYAETNGAGNGITVYSNNVGTKNAVAVFVDPTATGTKAIYASVAPGHPANVIEVQDTSPATVFAVDSAGNTTTPSVVLGGSRITISGDSNVVGSPLEPRVTASSGSVYLGRSVRVLSYFVSLNGPFDLETDTFVQDRQPTIFYIANNTAGPQPVTIHKASRYANGTEIVILCLGANPISLIDGADPTQSLFTISTAPASPQAIAAGAGRRLTAFNIANGDVSGAFWMVTGLVP